jgi:hypothetical protein
VNLVTIDLDDVDPAHLEELVALIRQRQAERTARLAEVAERPALGHYLSRGEQHDRQARPTAADAHETQAPPTKLGDRDWPPAPDPTDPGPLSSNGSTPEGPPWPVLDEVAFHGPIGRFVQQSAPHTEADPAAMLLTNLVGFGALVGRKPHVKAGNVRHPCCLFATVVGDTAKARKGTSLAPGLELLAVLDEAFSERRIMGGFGSGEKLVDELAEPDAADRRMLVVETEFARILRVSARDGSVLSQIIRDAWDGRPLQVRTRAKTSIAPIHHVGTIGHITAEELALVMTQADLYGGLANRFLWGCAHKVRDLPAGGNVPTPVVNAAASALRPAVDRIERSSQEVVVRTRAAEKCWSELYLELGQDNPGGALGAVVCRDAPQVLRLSLTYAMAASADAIDVEHIEAAYAVWRYCRASAAMLFGDSQGDASTDRLLSAIRRAGLGGLDGTGQFEALGRHVKAKQLDAMRRLLEERGLVVSEQVNTDGRPRLISYALAK